MSITYPITFAYSSHQVSSQSLHSKRFPTFLFSSSNPVCPRTNLSRKWSIWDIISFYISSFIKIRSPIRKINLPQFSRFPRIPDSPSNSPNVTGSSRNLKYELAQDPSKYQISLRSGYLFVSYKYLIFSNYPPPNSTRERIRSGYISHVS